MRFLAVLFLCLALPTYVEAKPHYGPATAFSGDRYLSQRLVSPRVHKARHAYRVKKTRTVLTLTQGVAREAKRAGTVILGGRPAGCPSRFCGCGASLYVFGRIIPVLNLAANWLRFPRAAPASGMVAARRGHVFVLKQHIAGTMWLVHDSNSGRGRTRIHPRSIAGYVIVNPRGGRA